MQRLRADGTLAIITTDRQRTGKSMNIFIRMALKLLSNPKFDMTRNYEIVRRFQVWAAAREEIPEDFVLLDQKILSSDQTTLIPVRMFAGNKVTKPGTLVFLHGGGYATGNVDSYTPTCIQMVQETGCRVLAVDYRLAPEFPFPAGLEDCYEVLRFLAADGSGRFRPLTVVGDSAGGNLATVACTLLAEKHLPLPDGQILIYPAVGWDYSENSPFASIHEKAEGYGLTRKKLNEYYEMYVPEGVDKKDPRIAPLLSDQLSALPRTLIFTAEHDPLRDEGEAYAGALLENGVSVTGKRIKDVPHGFWAYEKPFPEAVEKVYEGINQFLGEHRI